MNCQEVRQLLEPYSDRELELIRHVEIEAHLAQCAECAEQEQRLAKLRAAVASPSLYFPATESLRERLQLSVLPAAVTRGPSPIRLATTCAAALLVIGISFTLGWQMRYGQNTAEEQIAELVIANHGRSLQVDHLMDVASTDRHTVKPWFLGKLDFSPQVPDLSAEHFILAGGRLDYLSNRPVAALVYYLRSHAINVLTWPTNRAEEKGVRSLLRHGFHLRFWEKSGMSYWVISDLNDQDLDEFVHLFQKEQSPKQQ